MHVSKAQRQNAFRLFAFTLLASSSYTICRIVADAVLLTRLGSFALPPMLAISALVVGTISFVWARRTKDLPLHGLILSTQLSSALATAVLVVSMKIWPSSMLVICSIYVLAELRACFNAIQLAVLLNENFTSRSEKQRFAFVNAGAPCAGIIVGTFLGIEARVIDPAALLAFSCVLDVLSVLVVRATTKGVRLPDSVRQLSTHAAPTLVVTNREDHADAFARTRIFARAILWMVVCKTVVLAIVTYEWKVFAVQVFPNDERALTSYFGTFYAISDGLVLVLQLLVTRFLLKHTGVAFCILLLPIYLTVVGILSLLTRDPWLLLCILTAARGSMVIRWGIHQVAVQILYGALPTIVRRGTVAHVLGIAKPIAEACVAAGIGILIWYIPVRTFAWFWLPVLAVWLYWTARIALEWSRLDRRAIALVGENSLAVTSGEVETMQHATDQ